ncbi:MAG: CDP-alcohol phosphatidyltransferase family protein [Chitinophagaceae bacterium]|nr:CDP-alcohol phosphatidyltransferase family protein [Chitinophagaceae bacterium]
MKQIPNIFTLLNLVFGCIAIVFILQTGESIVYLEGNGFSSVVLPEKIALGALFIFAAGVVDFLDGFLARLMKAGSEMGKQLDSLSDVVSFGVAPGMILYQLLRMSYAQEAGGLDISIIWLLPAFLVTAAAAWRLARFNLDPAQQYGFKGLPAPAAGITIASIPLIIHYNILDLQAIFINSYLVYAVIVVLSFLMVSRLPMMALKFTSFSPAANWPKYLLVIIGIAAAVFVKWLAVPVVLVVYILLSLLFKNKAS